MKRDSTTASTAFTHASTPIGSQYSRRLRNRGARDAFEPELRNTDC
jgi:hypothetical protein